jgi:RNA polymerase sigma factor (sigma-70 family)
MTTPPLEPGDIPDGDEDRDTAFSRFYRGSVVALVSLCIQVGVPAADAPELVQELMVEIYKRWSEVRSPGAYARRVIAYRAGDFLKISSRTSARDDMDVTHRTQPLAAGLADELLVVGEEQLVLQALGRLPPMQRAVFALVYDGFTPADIGAILNLEEATVRSHLRHARKTLQSWWIRRVRRERREVRS